MPADIARFEEGKRSSRARYADGGCHTGWALDQSGDPVHVSEVANGYGCGCRCATCGQALSAKQGSINIWHFAHQYHVLCAPETALHLAAKDILAEAARAHAGMTVPGQETTGLRSAELEVRISSGRVVDVMVRTIGPMYAIEIAVTHRKSSPAAADIVRDGYRGFEIDLSRVSASATRDEVRQAVLHEAPRHWLEAPRISILADPLDECPQPQAIKRRSARGREILTYIHAQLERHPEYYARTLAWPVLRARGARFTASLDMTDEMRAAYRISPWLMALDNVQFEQVSEEGGLQFVCHGGVATGTNSALVLVCLYIACLGPAPVDKDKPTLMIGCPDDLNSWERRLSMHWEGIGRWQARLEERWAATIQKG